MRIVFFFSVCSPFFRRDQLPSHRFTLQFAISDDRERRRLNQTPQAGEMKAHSVEDIIPAGKGGNKDTAIGNRDITAGHAITGGIGDEDKQHHIRYGNSADIAAEQESEQKKMNQ